MKWAPRMEEIGTEEAFVVLEKAQALEKQGREILHLEIGEPDFPTPDPIVKAAIRALEAGLTRYGPPAGLPELRQAVARKVTESRGIEVAPEEVVITAGAKPILFFTLLALISRGDQVLLPNPGFPIYESVVRLAGGTPVSLPLRQSQGFRFSPNDFDQLVGRRTRLIILNSPHNPTGSVLSPEDLEQIASAARRYNITVLSDEIYRHFLYEGTHRSILSLPGMKERTILLDGFSKSYAMTGWRLGYGVMPRTLVAAVETLIVNSYSCTPAFIQYAGLAALREDTAEIRRRVEIFRKRRDLVVTALQALPEIRCLLPPGAFYVFPSVTIPRRSSREIADHLLSDAGVALLPGTAFGNWGEGHLRLSYAASEEVLQQAVAQIAASLPRLSRRP